MKKLLIILALCLAPKAWATAYVANTTGNWASSATWSGAGIPGCGDTAIINNGVTVTIPAGTAACIGTSPVDNTGTAALACQSTTGTGILIVYGALTRKGRFDQCNAPWTISTANWTTAGDGSVTYDATGASNPATALYGWPIGLANGATSAVLNFTGTSSHHVVVNSVSNINSGGFGSTFTDAGSVNWSYADISYQGAATTSGLFLTYGLNTAAGKIIMANTTIDHCAEITSNSSLGAASTWNIQNVTITNPVNSTASMRLQLSNDRTTGVRIMSHMVVDGLFYFDGVAGHNTGFTIDDWSARQETGTYHTSINFSHGASSDSFSNVLFFGTQSFNGVPSGTITNGYVMIACNTGSNCLNSHPINILNSSFNSTFSGWVWDGMQVTDDGDEIEPISPDATVAATLNAPNNYFLPNAAGLSVGSLINNSSGDTQTNLKINLSHVTAVLSATGGTVLGVGCEVHTVMPAGAVPNITNNMFWRPVSGTGFAAQSVVTGGTPCTVAPNMITTADYNGIWNITGGLYGGNPAGQFAGTPGTDDITGNPGFVDSTRNFMAYDTAGLGHAVGTAWVTSHAYAAGDIVSNSVVGFFGGATYNYTCTVAHTSGATTQPGAGSTFNQFWVPSTEVDIEAGILAGTTPNVASLSAWVKAGFDFHNAAFHNAGSDGLDIGAGSYIPPAAGPSVIFSGKVTTSGKVVTQ